MPSPQPRLHILIPPVLPLPSLLLQFIGASLQASNIVAPIEAKPPRGQPLWCIVTEFMAGGTLRAYIARKSSLKVTEAVKYALDIARGLE